MHADVHRFARSSTVFRAGFDHHRRSSTTNADEHAERENAADDDEDGPREKSRNLARKLYHGSNHVDGVFLRRRGRQGTWKKYFKIRERHASAREHIQRDRRRLEMTRLAR